MTLKSIFKTYKYRLLFTLTLILLEAAILILFPLFIGYAIDDAINQSYVGALQLGMLGVAVMVVGVGRRMYDSRFYGKLYENIGAEVISKAENQTVSVKNARLNMIRELVEFLENALPELINSIIGLVGVIVIIATLNLNIFYGSLVVTLLIFMIYWLTSGKTVRYNQLANDEFERQTDVITEKHKIGLQNHLKLMMKWNIKLSDLEALNFSASWLVALVFLVLSIVVSISDGLVQYGALFALVMYVFQYIENVLSLPLFYQNWLRLKEILERQKAA